MSTQLILYPQNYKGSYSSVNSTSNQILVNGAYFTGLNSTTLLTTASAIPWNAAIIQEPPNILGDWYRYTNAGVVAPQATSNNLYFSYNGTEHSGIYQQLSGLAAGGIYDVVIDIETPAVGTLTIKTYSGVYQMSSFSASSNSSTVTGSFTANSPNDIILIDYTSSGAPLLIDSIKVNESITSPTLVYSDLIDGQVICDLYQEEDIPLTLSIDDFKNAAEKIHSYSKDFNLPATKRNNRIFDNMFEITRADDQLIFNPYRRTRCVLKQDGFILFEGYLRMIDIKDKNGEISYNVNLYSEVIVLADLLKDKTFNDLNLSELTHIYKFENIKDSWENIGAGNGLTLLNPLSTSSFAYDATTGVNNTQVLKYPFVAWNAHIYGTQATNFNLLAGISSTFRPFIQLKYLLNKIFAGVGFTWTSNFFDSPDFEKLFMDFNWGEEQPLDITNTGEGKGKMGGNEWATAAGNNYNIGNQTYTSTQGFDQITDIFTVPAGQINAYYSIDSVVNFIFILDGTITVNWLLTEAATGNTEIILPLTSPTVTGSAIAYANLTFYSATSSAIITSIDVSDGGFYASAPSVEIEDGIFGAVSTLTAVGSFPGAVTSVTFISGQYGYLDMNNPPKITFNNINPQWGYTANFNRTMQPGDTLELKVQGSADLTVRQDNRQHVLQYPAFTGSIILTSTIPYITSQSLLKTLRGELGQWDFLKGIMTMFNLVSLSDEGDPNNILIEPYADLFVKNTNGGAGNLTLADRSIEHDWTGKVDVSQMELKPLTDLTKTTTFKFVDDEEDRYAGQYKHINSGHSYGSLVWDASGLDVLQGEEEIIAEPFAATVLSPLRSGMSEFIVPFISGGGGVAEIENLPRIMYNAGVSTLTSCTYSVPASAGGSPFPTENKFLQFGHLSEIPITSSTQDFNFASNQLYAPLNQNGTVENLFNEYWLPYYGELYHPDTRIMTLKVNLSASDIAGFKLYDTVFIKNRSFRVNKIEYKPNSLAKVEFILVP